LAIPSTPKTPYRDVSESAAQHRQLSRPIEFRHLDLPDPHQHLLRRAAQPAAQERNRERRFPRDARQEPPRLERILSTLALERALAKLTQHQRDVFLLYEVEGFRHAEIAGMLEMTETASKNTLFQARENLRLMLEPPRSSAAEAR